MNVKRLLYSTIFLELISACKPSTTNEYNFDPNNLNIESITLSSIADDINYLPVPNTFPVGNIGSFIFINKSIYFNTDYEIIAFDRVKRQLKKIGSKGRGPGEYLFNTRFTVDEKTGMIYILDQGDIIKMYSGLSGQFLSSFPLQKNGSAATIDFLGLNLFVTYSLQYENGQYSWIVFDTSGNVIKKRKSGIPIFSSSYSSGSTYKLGNSIYYWNEYTDTVFSVSPDLSEKPSFLFLPGEHRFPRSKDVPINPFEKFMVVNSIFETDRYIVFNYYFNNPVLLLYDKIDKKNYKIDLEIDRNNFQIINGIENDLDGGLMFVPIRYILENNREYLVGVINPSKLKLHVGGNEFQGSATKYPEKKKYLENLVNMLKETDNSIFVMVRLKK